MSSMLHHTSMIYRFLPQLASMYCTCTHNSPCKMIIKPRKHYSKAQAGIQSVLCYVLFEDEAWWWNHFTFVLLSFKNSWIKASYFVLSWWYYCPCHVEFKVSLSHQYGWNAQPLLYLYSHILFCSIFWVIFDPV